MRVAAIALLVSLGVLSGAALAGKSVSGPVGQAVAPRPPVAANPGHGHRHHHRNVFVGGAFGWGWWYPPPYYYAYPVAVPGESVTYVEQGEAEVVQPGRWWYYCESSAGFYPYVRECPAGWERVPPR